MIDSGTLHVWRVTINTSDFHDQDWSILSADEKKRGERFKITASRNVFVQARAAMRQILARYLNTKPEDLTFSSGKHGKLFLEQKPLQFNLSHSGDIALLAVTRDIDVGVDIERIDPTRAGDAIVRRYFSTRERDAFAVVDEDRTSAFFRIWTRKEAVIKMLGEGLACPLDSFDIDVDANNPRLLDFRREGIMDKESWQLININARGGYTACIALAKPCVNADGFDFSRLP